MDEKLRNDLAKSGLTAKEAAIYQYLLSSGGAFPSRIASDTGIKRATAYNILAELSIKGLVNEVERRNKLYYQIASPNSLVRYARHGIRIAEDELAVAKRLLPSISEAYARAQKKPRVLYFEGAKEVMEIYEDHVANPESYEMLSLAGVDDIMQFVPTSFHQDYVRHKAKHNVTTRAIMPDNATARSFLPGNYSIVDKKYWPDIRFTKKDFAIPGEITLYGRQKISIVNLEKGTVVGIMIDDAMIYNMFHLLFELSWDGLND